MAFDTAPLTIVQAIQLLSLYAMFRFGIHSPHNDLWNYAFYNISLTVAKVHKDSFSVSIIPHTASLTTLSSRRVGDSVNLENDCIGKYVERLMGRGSQNRDITAGFLTKYGF
ncbi:hypothetical protein ACRQU7_01260 [Caproiciproducens sp. R1]|uniref:hypothetical protein n=1 Tax=Caproiciproducens sp. R1 TaxID=3435000 RepID=UPI004033A938